MGTIRVRAATLSSRLALLLVVFCLVARASAQTAPSAAPQGFVAPPRSIADITAVLDSDKPDPAKLARYTALVDAQPPAGASPSALARFYRDRAAAAGQIGRAQQWVTDAQQALKISRDAGESREEALIELINAEFQVGNYAAGVDYAQQRAAMVGNRAGGIVSAHSSLARSFAQAGHLKDAETEIQRIRDALNVMQAARRIDPISLRNQQGNAADAIGTVYEVQGRLADAERELSQGVAFADQMVRDYDEWVATVKPPREIFVGFTVQRRLRLAVAVHRQGRLAEAELIARTALLISLHQQGRYAPVTAQAIAALAVIILDEDRPQDARRLAEAALDVYRRIGASTGSRAAVLAGVTLASSYATEDDWRGAMTAYDNAQHGIGPTDEQGRVLLNNNLDRIVAELKTGRVNDALQQVTQIAGRREQNLGPNHPDTLDAEGLRAAALYVANRHDEALAAFRVVVPKLVQSSRVSDTGEASPVLRDRRLRFELEAYITLLSESRDAGAATEAFAVADIVRGQAVQRALSESAARSSVRDPALADLVRREQDARGQANALFGLLASIQAAPAGQRDDQAVAAVRAEIDQLRTSRAAVRQEIERRYPDYANLIDPRPVTVDQIQKVLAPGEAMLSFYVGSAKTFVWAVPASGSVAFAAAPLSATQITEDVRALRRALEPNAATLGDIPAFDVALAYKLYAALLAPVASGWHGAHSLLVVPHGALGELPLSLLPTAPTKVEAHAGAPLFSEYKSVPWLIRQVAVTQLPSATSLATLRGLPPGDAHRRAFAGFGDPWFNEAEAREAAGSAKLVASNSALATRGVRLHLRAAPKTETASTATVADLPRLPETADEVRSVATALKANLATDVFIGDKANEEAVRTLNLKDRRVVMFATHGLVPGDLDGLQEPALALSAPAVAHISGDGLLTMSKILGLKLDADWVVLSACNTAAGDGAGAEAVSGLGRAFFYAGTRAVLVSNWPVETNSARALTTDLFRRQAEKPGLGRAEALRQAELGLIDGEGSTVDGKTVFSYAHPIFWAPFAVIGDGGGKSS